MPVPLRPRIRHFFASCGEAAFRPGNHPFFVTGVNVHCQELQPFQGFLCIRSGVGGSSSWTASTTKLSPSIAVMVIRFLNTGAEEILPRPGMNICPGNIDVEIEISKSAFDYQSNTEFFIETSFVFKSQRQRSFTPILTCDAYKNSDSVFMK